MKISTFIRHLRESFKSLARNGWMMFASASAVTITLLLVGVFFVIIMNMNKFANDIEKDVEIRVHIDLTAKKADQEKLRSQIESINAVQSVKYSSKQHELKDLIKTMGNDFKLFKQENPLYDVYIVKTKNPTDTPKVAKQIEKMDHVESAIYGKGKVENLFHILSICRNIGLVLIIALLLTAMFLISNTIKITIFARRKEIEIMKLVGATNWFIRWPFLLEGLWLGILGSIIPILIVSFGYYYLYELVSPKLQNQFIQILDFTPFVYEIDVLLILMGILIGVWGSTMSIRRYLKV
ncbi:permease-like cell division protein FtsX [Heyndrickxia ginsengihumi]|uniref:Cell division protein FtsX n=1 Tax=Heyndrickxia ginsengihumi TaxID=363870 RepID=A0A0A6Y2E1_9BACI|nr:permease-like cell division protein FtsX [Heyndrickxia ginsengihumi]KHD86437.1 cell division protein FtsX [Heyndrickxia ginsengihumi]MBE6184272.1 ABC transporter permease [Bacillus sp. (in: firmicutes)]MCM3024066.1 permease-like cell division protein FtsX [Heyndrickxia ginsengihumi]NEY19181.1 ABC transporter permease [Heyndrickxia ginsengihumi]